jgi:hypothetical protein
MDSIVAELFDGTMKIPTATYIDQAKMWPRTGRHILAHFDEETIVVYQAYRAQIGRFAAENGCFGDGFSYNRISWIKPNFLWMMYRSNWGRSDGQEVVLAIRLRRHFFEDLLAQAVQSTYVDKVYPDRDEWKDALRRSNVRLQWDPDHLPTGQTCERRAIQLGLRGEVLREYGKRQLLEVIDVSDFAAEQRVNVETWADDRLVMPLERVYAPSDPGIAKRIGLDSE